MQKCGSTYHYFLIGFYTPTYLAGWFGHGPSYWDNSRGLNVLRTKTNGMIHQVEITINSYNNHDSLRIYIYIHIHMYRCSTQYIQIDLSGKYHQFPFTVNIPKFNSSYTNIFTIIPSVIGYKPLYYILAILIYIYIYSTTYYYMIHSYPFVPMEKIPWLEGPVRERGQGQ